MERRPEGFPGGRPLFIGSLPLQDHHQALQEVLRRCPETPHWVQLPANPQEGMLVQFSEGLPGLRTEPRVWIDNGSEQFEAELLAFYEEYLAVSESGSPLEKTRFAMSPLAAPGLHLLLQALEGRAPLAVKGQITGPVTALLGIPDHAGRSAYYDERLRDSLVKLLALKARWQVEQLARGGRRVMLFLDEPALGGLGSSTYITVSFQDAMESLNEVLGVIHRAGAWTGLHVCSNTDWGALLDLDLDLLSFDAFSYFERVALFGKELRAFLARGGMIAWGIIPTALESLEGAQARPLVDLWQSQAEELASDEWTVEGLLERTLITPG